MRQHRDVAGNRPAVDSSGNRNIPNIIVERRGFPNDPRKSSARNDNIQIVSSTDVVPRNVSQDFRGTPSLPLAPLLPSAAARREIALFLRKLRARNENEPKSIVDGSFSPNGFRKHSGNAFTSAGPVDAAISTTVKPPCSISSCRPAMISNNTKLSTEVVLRTGSQDLRGAPLLRLALLFPPASARPGSLSPMENPRAAMIANRKHRRPKLFPEGFGSLSGSSSFNQRFQKTFGQQ